MNVADIIKKHLREIGADGLCNPDQECGCSIDDMEPCEIINISDCVPAKRVKCTKECEHEGGPPYDYHYEEIDYKPANAQRENRSFDLMVEEIESDDAAMSALVMLASKYNENTILYAYHSVIDGAYFERKRQ